MCWKNGEFVALTFATILILITGLPKVIWEEGRVAAEVFDGAV